MSDEKGFLTETDRAFLTGEKEYTGDNAKQLRYQRRQAIAERARQAFHDFSLLFDVLDEHERDRIFDVPAERHEEFHDALVDTFAFLYLTLETDVELKDSQYPDRTMRAPFETLLEEGISRAEAEHRHGGGFLWTVHVDFDVTVQRGFNDLAEDRAIEKIAKRDYSELTKEEMHYLLLKYGGAAREFGRISALQGVDAPDSYAELDERIAEVRDEIGVPERALTDEEIESIEDDMTEVFDGPVDESGE